MQAVQPAHTQQVTRSSLSSYTVGSSRILCCFYDLNIGGILRQGSLRGSSDVTLRRGIRRSLNLRLTADEEGIFSSSPLIMFQSLAASPIKITRLPTIIAELLIMSKVLHARQHHMLPAAAEPSVKQPWP